MFFSKLTRETFVQFMLILGTIENLTDFFHKYYVLYKFFEFVPVLDLGISKFTFALLLCFVEMAGDG